MIPRPIDAMNFNEYIDVRFRDLLAAAMEPKDMIKALEAATAWVKAKHAVEQGDGYGTKLGRTMNDDG